MLPVSQFKKMGLADKARLLIVAVLMDLIDYLGVPMLPIIGDVIDLFATGLFYFISRKKSFALLTLVELVPGVDIVPTYTMVALGMIAHGDI